MGGGLVDSYCEHTRTVYQFQGCFFHGCKKCYLDELAYNAKLDQEMGDLYQRRVDRCNLLKSNGYNVIQQWECEWLKSPLYKKADLLDIGPLNLRNAYYGGHIVWRSSNSIKRWMSRRFVTLILFPYIRL